MCASRAPFVARSPARRRSIEARAAIVDEWRSTASHALDTARRRARCRRRRAPDARAARAGALLGTSRARVRTRATRRGRRRLGKSDALRGTLDAVAVATLRALGGVARDVAGNANARPARFPRGPREDVALELVYDPLMFLERASEAHGDAVGLTLAGENVVLVSSPALARAVLVDQSECFQKDGTAFFPGSSLAGNGLLVSDGETWARQRRLSNPAFRKAAVETYARCMIEVGERLVNKTWSRRGRRDVYADFNDATLEIVASALFGADVVGARASTINGAIKDSFEFFGRRAATGMIIPEWAPTFDNVRYNDAVKRLDEEVYSIIAKRRRAMASGEQKNELDLLDRLLLEKDENEGDGNDATGMSDKALRDELMTLMVAGQETSAILLSWACALIAERPDVGDKIATEVRRTLENQGKCWLVARCE